MKTPGPHRAAWLLAFTALGLVACNDDPSKYPTYRLEGSLSQVMDVGYDKVRVLLAPTDISVLFVREKKLGTTTEDGGVVDPMMAGVSEDYPLRIGYRVTPDELDGGRLDLTAVDTGGQQRGVASRTVQNDPRNTLPRIERGTLFLQGVLEAGREVSGDFNITFENGIEAASGRTVFSKQFKAQVQ